MIQSPLSQTASTVPRATQFDTLPTFRRSPPKGWPWDNDQSRSTQIDDAERLPKITIVTPSFQQGPTLEATIRSVLFQHYPNLEYLVFDGGSTDESVEIIRHYDSRINYWKSQKDNGQAAAVNDAFAQATGEILCWLNSDDILLPNALNTVGALFLEHPDWQWLYGQGHFIDLNGTMAGRCDWVGAWTLCTFYSLDVVLQPAAFWRKTLWDRVGPLDLRYQWGFDWDWFIRASHVSQPNYIADYLAGVRITPTTKTATGGLKRQAEIASIARRYGGFWQPTNLVYMARRLGDVFAKVTARFPVLQQKSYWLHHRVKMYYAGQYME